MRQVAGFVIRDREGNRPQRPVPGHRGEDLGHVPHLGTEGLCAVAPGGIVSEQVGVVLHGGPTAGGIDHHRGHLNPLECLDELPGQPTSRIQVAGVQVQCAATPLVPRCDDLVSRRSQHAHGRLVDAGKQGALDAPGQKAHPPYPPTYGERDVGEGPSSRRRRHRRQQRFHLGQPRRQDGDEARGAHQTRQPKTLVPVQRGHNPPHPLWIREQGEDHAPPAAIAGRALVRPLDLGARRLQQALIGHTGWTCRLAGETPEALIQVLDEHRTDVRLPLLHHAHHVDAPPRGCHLDAGREIRGARGQA